MQRFRQTGVDVDLRIEGDRRPCRPAVDLSAYRIVQEGLTYVLKHSDAAWAETTVRYSPDSPALEVRDDGRARPPSAARGHGLDGLARACSSRATGRSPPAPAPAAATSSPSGCRSMPEDDARSGAGAVAGAGHARAVVVDDQPIVRAPFHTILATQPDLRGCSASGRMAGQAVELGRKLRPDVVLMDILMAPTSMGWQRPACLQVLTCSSPCGSWS